MLKFCSAQGTNRIASTQALRAGKVGSTQWQSHHLSLFHHQVGGTTATARKIFFPWDEARFLPAGPLPTLNEVPFHVPRDASTILRGTKHTRTHFKAPKVRVVSPPGVTVLREYKGQPVYHGGGGLATSRAHP